MIHTNSFIRIFSMKTLKNMRYDSNQTKSLNEIRWCCGHLAWMLHSTWIHVTTRLLNCCCCSLRKALDPLRTSFDLGKRCASWKKWSNDSAPLSADEVAVEAVRTAPEAVAGECQRNAPVQNLEAPRKSLRQKDVPGGSTEEHSRRMIQLD